MKKLATTKTQGRALSRNSNDKYVAALAAKTHICKDFWKVIACVAELPEQIRKSFDSILGRMEQENLPFKVTWE